MASYLIAIKHIFSTIPIETQQYLSISTWSFSPPDQSLVSTAVSILKHHRFKSRWTQLRTLSPSGFTSTHVSEITLQLRNNPHLALRFFLFTVHHSLCSHSLDSYATIIHTLSRSRLKSYAQELLRSAIREFPSTNLSNSSNPPPIFETLVKTYRSCDSAPFVFDLLIKACLQAKRIDQSIQIVRMLRSKGIYPRTSTCNSLIELVSKKQGCYAGYDIYKEVFGLSGGIESGRSVNAIVPNANTYNTIMAAFYRDGLVENVEDIWMEMARMNCMPSGYSYIILMASYCDYGRMVDATRVWDEMGLKEVKPDVLAYNTIIGGFCKVGEVGRAEEFYREMVMGEIEDTCVTFEHLINGYCKIGDVDCAMLLYSDMYRKGFRPESSTIDALIRCLCERSRVLEALEFLRVAIKKHGVFPRGTSYETLICGLCQEGRVEEALKLQAQMVGNGYEPNSEIYNAFIDGYMKQGNNELAGKLREEMLENAKRKQISISFLIRL